MSEKEEKKEEAAIDKEPEKKKGGGIIKIIIVVLVLAAVFLVAYFTGVIEYLNINNVVEVRDTIQEFGVPGYLIFIVVYVVAAVFMLPAFIFTVAAGAAFGPVMGGILALVAATVGAMIAFIVARYVARDSIVNRFGSSPLFKKIDDGLRDNGVSFLILTRLVPIFPYNVQNYIYGLTPINLMTFVIVSFITMAPGAFIYAYMAGEIVDQVTAGEGVQYGSLFIQFIIAGVVLFLVSLIPKYIAKKKGIKLKDD